MGVIVSRSSSKGSNSKSNSGNSSSKHEKPQEAHSSNKNQSSSGLPTSNAFPFFFPNPSLLYTPLGLGGLNPFALQPGVSGYDSLGLLNGGLGSAASQGSKLKSSSRSSAVTTTSSAGMTISSAVKPPSRPSSKDSHIQQLLLPPDTQILEGISKLASGSFDGGMKMGKADKKEDKRKALESLRGTKPPINGGFLMQLMAV